MFSQLVFFIRGLENLSGPFALGTSSLTRESYIPNIQWEVFETLTYMSRHFHETVYTRSVISIYVIFRKK